VFHAQIAQTRGNSIDNSLAALETEAPQRFAETVLMDARHKVAGERRDSSKVYADRRIGWVWWRLARIDGASLAGSDHPRLLDSTPVAPFTIMSSTSTSSASSRP
jgi:hypothetical protein